MKRFLFIKLCFAGCSKFCKDHCLLCTYEDVLEYNIIDVIGEKEENGELSQIFIQRNVRLDQVMKDQQEMERFFEINQLSFLLNLFHRRRTSIAVEQG